MGAWCLGSPQNSRAVKIHVKRGLYKVAEVKPHVGRGDQSDPSHRLSLGGRSHRGKKWLKSLISGLYPSERMLRVMESGLCADWH